MDRLVNLRRTFSSNSIDGLLIGSAANRLYLSGFTGSAGWLLVSQDKALLLVDFRYVEQAKRECPRFEQLLLTGSITGNLPALARDFGISRLGIEAEQLCVSDYRSMCDTLRDSDTPTQIVPVSNAVESLRLVKEPPELEYIKKACELADRAMVHARLFLRAGITERQYAWELESFLRHEGSQQLPFDVIVASGPNAALPHARPTDKVICAGEPITIDLGARYAGYCSDLTRTIVLGEAAEQFWKVYNVVLAAQAAGLTMIKPVMNGGMADAVVRGMIDKAGYGEQFGHGLGHGVGMETHELPRLGRGAGDVLARDMAFTVEPGIYLPGWGGVRIEDTVVMQGEGVEPLTRASKEPIVHGG